jgi:hypothetical protein
MKINISPDSIFTGAIGAALFAKRDRKGDLIGVDLKALQKPVPSKVEGLVAKVVQERA